MIARLRVIFGGHSQAFRSQLTRLVRANLIAYSVALLAAPILSRIYLPEAFGGYGVFLAFLTFTAGLGGLRYESAIVSARDRNEARELALLAILSATLLSIVMAVVFGEVILLGFLDAGSLPLWTAVALSLNIWLAVAYGTCRYVLYFLGDVRAVANGAVAQSIGRGLSQIAFGLVMPTAGGLIAGETAGRGVAVGSVFFAVRSVLYRPFPGVRTVMSTARRHYQFPLYSLPSSLSDATVAFLPLPAIAALYGLHAAGLYAFVQRVVALPIGVFGNAVADTFHTELAIAARDGQASLYPLFVRTFRTLAAGGVLLATGLIVAGLTVFGPILGADWAGGGIVLAIVAPTTAAQIAVSPLSRTVFVLGGQRQKFLYDVVAVGAVFSSIGIALALNSGFLGFLALLTMSELTARCVYYLVLRRLVRNWDRVRRATDERPSEATDNA